MPRSNGVAICNYTCGSPRLTEQCRDGGWLEAVAEDVEQTAGFYEAGSTGSSLTIPSRFNASRIRSIRSTCVHTSFVPYAKTMLTW